ncbi:vomeronasal type-2 receptor 1-like [Ranitomeya imitator]|uniref:vomeronasal type-2 receptor 1-like n=1 Tax=Ranitomeya imitator TaxID=111125 RepID=UPI0037E7B480
MAFIFTIDEINRSPDLLPNVTLGYHVFDSCGNINKVIKDVLQIMTGKWNEFEIPNYSYKRHGVLAGYIGDLHPYTTNPMAELLSVFGYTQLKTFLKKIKFLDHYNELFRFNEKGEIPENLEIVNWVKREYKQYNYTSYIHYRTFVGIFNPSEREDRQLTMFLQRITWRHEKIEKIATSVLMGHGRKKTIATVLQNRWSFCHTSRM